MVKNNLRKVTALLIVVTLTLSCIMVTSAVSYSARSRWNTWGSRVKMPTSRVSLGVGVLEVKIYAIGGHSDRGMSWNEMYNPTADNWTTKAPMPTPRKSFGTAVYQDKIYVMGGQTDSEGGYYGIAGANEVYDPDTDTWENKTAMPTRRYGINANVVEGKVYVVGGKNASGWIDGINEVYDPDTDTWTNKAPISTPVSHYASAVLSDKIYVFGGYNGSTYTDLTQIYDPETDTWSNGTTIPTPMIGTAAAATTGAWAPKRIYVIGGNPPSGGINQGFFRIYNVQTYIYDPETDAWSRGAPRLKARIGCGVAVVDDILYAIGGTDFLYFSLSYGDNQCYTPYGYGTIPPLVSVFSPENTNYADNNVSLVFTVNKQASWTGYSLDEQDNVTITGNTKLPSLTSGSHTLTVYAEDTYENTGASEIISFSITEPFPTALVAITAAVVAVISLGALVYFKKRKH
jgi:N-acetylneuraminic acid mutarotase